FEQYPDLKANTTINQLMEELISAENKVAFARQGFNDMVTAYNNLRESFPNTTVANIFNFSPAQVLKVDDPKKREAIKIQFE
ncbi:MAG: LemA family protein, partial [Pseudobdellovibrionaceae bacterium]|nr:LemA family protein [Pseudobdellovibrionaceae bacterium]